MPDLKLNAIATRYAGVLFDLAKNATERKALLKEVLHLHTALKGAVLEWSYIINPTVSQRTQKKIIETLGSHLKLSNLLMQFLNVVCRNRRLQDLVVMLEAFEGRCKEAMGSMEGSVETTEILTPKEIKSLQLSLKEWLGKNVTLHQKTNENLLGGIVVRIGSLRIDGSTQTRLTNLHHVMKG